MDIEQLIAEKPLLHTDENGQPVDYSINVNVLRALNNYLKPGMHTLETGSGHTTIVFANIGTNHISISPYADEQARIQQYLDSKSIGTRTRFLMGSSDEILPNTELPATLDFVLIDGAHRFPFAMIDFHFTETKIPVGGILCVDDVHMPSVKILYKFLQIEKEWELIQRVKNTAFFKRLAPTEIYSDWQGQEMNRFFKNFSALKGNIKKKLIKS
ncbi:MAG: class I SAM-dependent methyltransferase [Bacteroidota bacterium]